MIKLNLIAQAMLLTGALSASTIAVANPGGYQDPILTMQGTPDVIKKGLDVDGYSSAVSAWNWGYPIVRMEQVAREYTNVPSPKPATSYRAPLNQIGWATELATPAAKDMPTANNDTLYMSSVIQLNEPYVLTVPDLHDRYYVVDVFNMWQELEHYIGRRATGTKAGKFVFVPPGWKGKLPADATALYVSTNKIWLWGRMRVSEGENMTPIHELQKAFKLQSLSGKVYHDTLPPMPALKNDGLDFLRQLSFAMQSNPVKPQDKGLFGQFSRMGLTDKEFDERNISPAVLEGVKRGLQDAPNVAVSTLVSTSQVRDGWSYVRGLDDFGYNYPLRSLVAGPYLGGQGEKEAVYPIRYNDKDNNPLSGQNTYTINLVTQPPVNAFWSITIYDADTKMLVENPVNRYKVGSDTKGLAKEKDGSLKIVISHEKPTGKDVNWLPAPEHNFYLLFRMYQPKEAVMDGSWKLPEVVKDN
ncbi:DUF1254 domain-containing protein [Klebsiella michiganensis]|uniref:DUF1254 domain-containing protein n=1 Tax=Klebsiella michiganensis TaxID=1134687 RepID=UPI000FEB9934|nr:DUF1254 domain-containing protein [Klebsiella michiganensis]ELT1809529.1 DUF1254 domain-containing protein [Klebsiella michiganensis]ELT1811329.1 DUF1254 domain-containing protein [Klebsiella michiganensis]MDV0337526.1 DUF1214 domain-containing protein [Klebsiella michiganensis]MDV0353051.1 DUF1214 domain-containing protein [Klebsiella michiganensis]MDV0401715.1 DUF1214 domain-containing protein [Klebsiella michiganensis]